MKGKVLLGMSGGIDSTVSAMLLLEQGYEVVGVTFRTYDSMKESCIAKEKGCCTIESIMEAKRNAEKMGFEHHIVDFREAFEQQRRLQQRTQKVVADLQAIRPEVDDILLELWNQIEKHFENEPPEVRFAECRKFGVVYYYRRHEPHDY